ncbi:glycosyltransferase family 2 protein [Aerosakkonemataceae cyanobacterium BLCC-F50]|uniref:Glycosyltransferase family 2 protein n=1 Tax=Floridaenema flaviceps BLCC-F50 TaxID=3153642 RepID=A0ABV4Y4X3_9CYAN
MMNFYNQGKPEYLTQHKQTDSSQVRLSVALVTRNRPESLERCLKSWRSQTVAPFEIVVSDDSDENYAPKIEDLAKEFNCVYTKGPRRGLYANRNHASLNCRGTHILSGDDDHTHPQDYVERILEVVESDRQRVWIFPERNYNEPNAPLLCPPELYRSGCGCTPKDPSDCAAIADGSSVYPRQIFDQGLRYDETYRFGPIWYLWGKILRKHGWRISYSDATFVWHWHYAINENRYDDPKQLHDLLECTMYVLFVHAFWIVPSWENITWSILYLLRATIFPGTALGYSVKVRLKLTSVFRLLKQAWQFHERENSQLNSKNAAVEKAINSA